VPITEVRELVTYDVLDTIDKQRAAPNVSLASRNSFSRTTSRI